MLLALSCLLRGLVYDLSVALMIPACLLLLLMLHKRLRNLNHRLVWLGTFFIIALTVIVFLQPFLLTPNANYWQHAATILGKDFPLRSYDWTAQYSAFGRLCFLAAVFYISLCIGQSRRLSLLFMQTLLFAAITTVTITFLLSAPNRFSSHFSYVHGFINPNHAAHFLAILMLLSLWQAHRWLRVFRARHLWRGYLKLIDSIQIKHLFQLIFIAFCALLLGSTLLLSNSRGGIMVALLAISAMVCILLLKHHSKHQLKRQPLLRIMPIFALAMLMFWILSPYGHFFQNTLQREGLDLGDRPEIYQMSLHMVADHPLLGVGFGNFASAFALYRTNKMLTEGLIDKAHSNYLEFAAEMGLPALLLLMALALYLLRVFLSGLSQHQERYGMPALGIGLWLLSATHSLFDFPLQIPALAAINIAILTICACQPSSHRRKKA